MTAHDTLNSTPQLTFLNGKGWLWGLLFFILTACNSHDGRFRLEGRFRNLNQGEFYIYNTEEGWKDTINVRDGRFIYERPMTDSTILRILFPNYSELPVFASSGTTVKMEGDASHLRETEIKGNDENKEMTAFRMRANKLTPPEVQASAEEYIRENPSSLVSLYIFHHYFLETYESDYQKSSQLCDILHKGMPNNGTLVRLQKQLTILKNTSANAKLQPFTATDINGKKVSNKQLDAPINIVMAWASWNAESGSIQRVVRKLQKKNPGKIAAISICLDANTKDIRYTAHRDSIGWPIICDGKMWQSPVAQKTGMGTMPANVIVDKQGKVIDRNLPTAKKMEEKLTQLLSENAR